MGTKKGSKKPVKREESLYMKYVDFAIPLLQKGLSSQVVQDMIKEKRKEEHGIESSTDALYDIVRRAINHIKSEHITARKEIIGLHLNRYNVTISRLRSRISTQAESVKDIEKKINDMHTLMDTMYAKERLLGIHKKGFTIEINNDIEHEESTTANSLKGVDLDKLSTEEMIEMLELLQAAKLSDLDLISVKLRKESSQESDDSLIEDVEIVEEIPNVNLIQAPEVLVDSQKSQSSTLLDIKERLRKANEKAAQEAFEKAKT